MKLYTFGGEEYNCFKIPMLKEVGCEAYSGELDCEHYHTYFVVKGQWNGFVCSHLKAKGNRGGWLTKCPLTNPEVKE